jgi:hypothetical protein
MTSRHNAGGSPVTARKYRCILNAEPAHSDARFRMYQPPIDSDDIFKLVPNATSESLSVFVSSVLKLTEFVSSTLGCSVHQCDPCNNCQFVQNKRPTPKHSTNLQQATEYSVRSPAAVCLSVCLNVRSSRSVNSATYFQSSQSNKTDHLAYRTHITHYLQREEECFLECRKRSRVRICHVDIFTSLCLHVTVFCTSKRTR